jgi:predicted amidohydrolase
MNADGVLAGEMWNEDDERSAVIVVDGEIVDLNERVSSDVDVTLARAININDAGMVLAEGFVDELSHYFLLVPAGE